MIWWIQLEAYKIMGLLDKVRIRGQPASGGGMGLDAGSAQSAADCTLGRALHVGQGAGAPLRGTHGLALEARLIRIATCSSSQWRGRRGRGLSRRPSRPAFRNRVRHLRTAWGEAPRDALPQRCRPLPRGQDHPGSQRQAVWR